MKHWKRIWAAMLAALLCAVFAGATVAEEEIALSIEGEGITPEEIQLEDVELEPGVLSEADDLAIELDDGALELDADLTSDAPAPANPPLVPNDGEDIPIDEAHFPDPNFRSYVAEFCEPPTINRDGVLTAEERGMVFGIYISGRGVADLRGIEYFPALTWLDCSNNQLTSLDVSGCTALTNLRSSFNPLTSLNVSGCTSLQILDCTDNQLTSLDVKGCTALQSLYCIANQLTSLDVSGLTSLKEVQCASNHLLTSLNMSGCSSLTEFASPDLPQLTSVNLSGCTSLLHFGVGDGIRAGQLSNLDLSGCTSLKEVGFEKQQITKLNVTECTSLQTLRCANNPLTSLDLSRNTALTYLDCSNNPLTSLDLSRNTALTTLGFSNAPLTSLDLSRNTALTTLFFSNVPLTSLDLSRNTALNWLDCQNNPKLTSLDLSNIQKLTHVRCTDNKQLASLNVNGCTSLDVLSCYNNALTSLDLSTNTALTYLECSNNALTSLDLSENQKLGVLICQDNKQLSSLNVSGCKELISLVCNSNPELTRLDLSKNQKLFNVECTDNKQLASLDVSGCEQLKDLYCSGNRLTSLDLRGCKLLKRLSVYNNKLKSLDITKNPKLVQAMKKGTDASTEKDIIDKCISKITSEGGQLILKEVCFDATTEITAKGKTLYAPPRTTVSIKKCKIGDIADQTYTGQAIKPVPVVKDGEKTLKAGTDYKVSYSANKDIGVATVTIEGKGDYDDSVKKTFSINPAAVALSKVTAGQKQLTVEWKKGIGGVGYELQYSLKKDFSTKSTVTVNKNGTVKYVIKKLTQGKTYYVRIRAFKKVGGKTYVSAWSKTLSKKVK